jgi:hypothetical protein
MIATQKVGRVSIPASMSFIFTRAAPAIIGADIRKEKRAASSRVRPAKSPVVMVIPDLEIPGIIAAA